MENVTRREVVGAAALAGSIVLAGLTPAPAPADEKPKAELDEKAERKRVIDCGMTEAEADCWVLIALAAGKFFELPKLHPMDDHEVAQAIHVVQHKLLSRPVYRKYKGLAKDEKK
ncbi:MAG TPA: hypothetical protein VFW33_13100 [Gemmataceae bacterium]|nr:hypothetical protein [Gemmataceae bacterium]